MKATMTSSNCMGDNHLDNNNSPAGSVSRSGRVRKKNSLLADYESSDVVEKAKRKSQKQFKTKVKRVSKSRSHDGTPYIKGKNNITQTHPTLINTSSEFHSSIYNSPYLTEPFDGDVPDMVAEEIIDDDLIYGEDDGSDDPGNLHAANFKLKTQAQSTYMLEKSSDKGRKFAGPSLALATKTKATRKDKGSPRVTAYMLWAKEQRVNFSKKYPHMDFSSISKKLSDLWATVPQNQKKMWKTKAGKIMRKATSGAENMKNSGAPTLILANKTVPSLSTHKLMKNTTPEELLLPKRPPGRPPKKYIHFLPTEDTGLTQTPGPSTKSYSYTSIPGPKKASLVAHKPKAESTVTSSSLLSIPGTSIKAQEPNQFQVTSIAPLDVAAQFSLLGESLTKMGEQLQNSQDQPVNESLSVLLDSLLSSMGPLLCLTKQVPELDCIPEDQLKRIIDNVGYFMPVV